MRICLAEFEDDIEGGWKPPHDDARFLLDFRTRTDKQSGPHVSGVNRLAVFALPNDITVGESLGVGSDWSAIPFDTAARRVFQNAGLFVTPRPTLRDAVVDVLNNTASLDSLLSNRFGHITIGGPFGTQRVDRGRGYFDQITLPRLRGIVQGAIERHGAGSDEARILVQRYGDRYRVPRGQLLPRGVQVAPIDLQGRTILTETFFRVLGESPLSAQWTNHDSNIEAGIANSLAQTIGDSGSSTVPDWDSSCTHDTPLGDDHHQATISGAAGTNTGATTVQHGAAVLMDATDTDSYVAWYTNSGERGWLVEFTDGVRSTLDSFSDPDGPPFLDAMRVQYDGANTIHTWYQYDGGAWTYFGSTTHTAHAGHLSVGFVLHRGTSSTPRIGDWDGRDESMETPPAAPVLQTTTPADDATDVAVDANLTMEFDIDVQAGTGSILIKKVSDDSTVATIPIGDAQVTISGTDVTINPTSDLENGVEYYVEIASGVIESTDSIAWGGVAKPDWSFTTVAAAAGVSQRTTLLAG